MDDLFALDGGRAATAWKKRHAKRRTNIESNRRKRAKYDAQEKRWETDQRRKARLEKFEEDARQRKLRREKLKAKIARDERRAFLKQRKAEGYRKPRLPYKYLVGRRFGRLLVVKPAGHNPSGSKRWWVKCDCGSPMKEIAGTNLQQGILRSCGCLKREQARKAARRKKLAKAKIVRRNIRGLLCKWKGVFGGDHRDAMLLTKMRAVLGWGEARMAKQPRPRLRSLPTMAQARRNAAKRRPR